MTREPHSLESAPSTTAPATAVRPPLLALWAALAATAILIAALALARGAAAQPFPPAAGGGPGAFTLLANDDDEEEGDDEAGDDGEEFEIDDECVSDDEAAEEACEEALEEKELKEEEAEEKAAECRLESAEASVLVLPSRDAVRLTVRYETYEPGAIAVDLGLRGGKGALDLGTDSDRFADSGTYRNEVKLTDAQSERAQAAKEFDVELRAVDSPGFCRGEFDARLSHRRTRGGGIVWSEDGAGAERKRRS